MQSARVLECVLDNDSLVVLEEGKVVFFGVDKTDNFTDPVWEDVSIFDSEEIPFWDVDSFLVFASDLCEGGFLADLDVEEVLSVEVLTEVDSEFHMEVDTVGEVEFKPDEKFAFFLFRQ